MPALASRCGRLKTPSRRLALVWRRGRFGVPSAGRFFSLPEGRTLGPDSGGWSVRTSLLQLLVTLASSSIPHTDDASVSLVRTDRFETVSATSDGVRAVDECQYRADEGPCVEAIHGDRRNNVALAEAEARWPEFVAVAREAGYAATLSIPLRLPDRTVGALNLYSRSEPFGERRGRAGGALRRARLGRAVQRHRTFHRREGEPAAPRGRWPPGRRSGRPRASS